MKYYIVQIRFNEGTIVSKFTSMNPYEYFNKLKNESVKKMLEFISFQDVTEVYTEWLKIKENQNGTSI